MPDHESLYRLAEQQGGYFSAAQATAHGFSHALLAHHARPDGRFERVRRGLYRIRLFPSNPHEEIVAAWIAAGPDVAAVSHDSALELYGLSDVIPSAVHLTVSRDKRWYRLPRGVRLHTTTQPLEPSEVRKWKGVRVTSPERTLADVAEASLDPQQLELAVRQAVARGLISHESLQEAISNRGPSVQKALSRAAAPVA
jgi:predicted transcriptional regulator of viral defense system